MIFSNDRTAKDALLNTLGDELAAAWVRRGEVGDSMRSRSIAAPVNLSTIGRSQPPRDWTPRSPRLSQRAEHGLRATGHFELSRTPAASLLDDRRPRSVALARGRALASAG